MPISNEDWHREIVEIKSGSSCTNTMSEGETTESEGADQGPSRRLRDGSQSKVVVTDERSRIDRLRPKKTNSNNVSNIRGKSSVIQDITLRSITNRVCPGGQNLKIIAQV